MNTVAKTRRKVKYDSSVPRCANCKSFAKPGTFLVNSLPRPRPPMCKLHGFVVKEHACCDTWSGNDGAILEKP